MSFTYPTVDVGGNTYDVLVAYADAHIYLTGRLGSAADAWRAATQDTREMGMIGALEMFDAIAWDGEKTDADNAHCLPRSGLTDVEGEDVDEDTIPTAAKEAYFILSAMIVENPSLQDKASATGSNVQSVASGSESVTFFAPQSGTRFPVAIHEKLRPFLGSMSTVVAAEIFGECEEDSFDECDSYDDGGSLA